ncbi:GAF domain-containing protein [Streptomyces sp. PA5.6]|uniref:GAF domain-containing protein n=1 Tax=Streptomyces sp. PA5.6 TaxID=3035651 RepID=UPI0039048386
MPDDDGADEGGGGSGGEAADAPQPSMQPILEAVLSVGTDLELQATLQHIVDSAARLTGAGLGTLGVDAPGHGGPAELFVAGGPARHPDGVPRVRPTSDGTVIDVPIHVHDEPFGTLLLAEKAGGGPFTDEDRQLLRVLASQAGIAIGNARLFEAARQRERWIEGAAAVTTALLTGEAAADALMTVADRARILAGAAAGVILQPTEAGGMRIVAAATDGEPHGWGASSHRRAPGDGAAGGSGQGTARPADEPTAPNADGDAALTANGPTAPSAHGDTALTANGPTAPSAHGDTALTANGPTAPSAHGDTALEDDAAAHAAGAARGTARTNAPRPTPHADAEPRPRASTDPTDPHAEAPTHTRPHTDTDTDTRTTPHTDTTTETRTTPHTHHNDLIGTTIEPGSAVLTQLLGGEPVYIDDSATDPRMTTHVRARFGPSMMLPLQAGGRLIGTLALPRRRGAPAYTSAERLLATQFASQAALALVLADAQQSRQRLAVFEDRDRIARDLHDLVVQRLFATGMMLEGTRRKARSTKVESTLDHAVDELESTIQEVRTAIFALQQPPADAPATFRGKVLRETAGASAVLGIQPSVHFAGAVDTQVTEPAAGHLLAALRRALAATSRRTGVTRVDVAIDARATLPDGRSGVRLTVYDDGDTEGGEPGRVAAGGGQANGAKTDSAEPGDAEADDVASDGTRTGSTKTGRTKTGGTKTGSTKTGGAKAGTTATWQAPL